MTVSLSYELQFFRCHPLLKHWECSCKRIRAVQRLQYYIFCSISQVTLQNISSSCSTTPVSIHIAFQCVHSSPICECHLHVLSFQSTYYAFNRTCSRPFVIRKTHQIFFLQYEGIKWATLHQRYAVHWWSVPHFGTFTIHVTFVHSKSLIAVVNCVVLDCLTT